MDGALPLLRHPGWREAFPWLVQGVTSAGREEEPFDLALFGGSPAGAVLDRWERLSAGLGMPRVVHGRQVHGTRVAFHGAGGPGLRVLPAADGHLTRSRGVLLTVATADCAAVSIVDPGIPAVALLHAGWRGTAAGIVERGIRTLAERLGSDPAALHLHVGPSICGSCYEVGPEVHRALGLDPPDGPAPVDLGKALVDRAEAAGLRPERITRSTLCTLCGESGLFSHRGGSAARQVTLLGLGPESR